MGQGDGTKGITGSERSQNGVGRLQLECGQHNRCGCCAHPRAPGGLVLSLDRGEGSDRELSVYQELV